MRIPTFICAAMLPLGLASTVEAGYLADSNRTAYTVLNPTPPALMRDWHTDDAGVSPYTIDPGHFEVDVAALTYGYYHRDELIDTTVKAWVFGATTLKAGLTSSLDVELSILPYLRITRAMKIGSLADSRTGSGFGDVSSRLKLNLWGNNGGTTALSASGNVQFPTASDDLGADQFEGGPSLEFAAQVPYGVELRVDSAVDLFEDNAQHRQVSFEDLISFSHQIVGPLQGFCVFNTVVYTTPNSDWVGQIGAGVYYRLKRNVELFARADFGVHGNPYDYSPFIGIAARF